jgi:spoIIIJ-associated protein
METQTSTAPAPSPAPAPVATPSVNPQEVLQKMLDGLGLQTKVELYHMDDAPLLHIATADPGRLIGKHGQTLQHLQFLVNRVLQRLNPDAPHVIVDCERYRERQRDDLIRIGLEAADKVRRWGEPVRIGPFGPFDRRIIHLHIQKDPELEAVSEGEEDGGRKRMVIRVKAKPGA